MAMFEGEGFVNKGLVDKPTTVHLSSAFPVNPSVFGAAYDRRCSCKVRTTWSCLPELQETDPLVYYRPRTEELEPTPDYENLSRSLQEL